MAILMRPGQIKEETVYPKNKKQKFTLLEISNIVGGIVEPLFLGSWWIFINKTGKEQKLKYNEYSQTLGLKVYGNCLLAKDSELSNSFFFPPEFITQVEKFYVKYMKEIENLIHNGKFNDDEPIDMDILDEKPVPDDLSPEKLQLAMNIGYECLIEKNIPFKELMKNFVIYEDEDGRKITIPNDKQLRLEAIDKLIEYFTEMEEYEKCSNLFKLKDFVEKTK